jgi:hypothetical protein
MLLSTKNKKRKEKISFFFEEKYSIVKRISFVENDMISRMKKSGVIKKKKKFVEALNKIVIF